MPTIYQIDAPSMFGDSTSTLPGINSALVYNTREEAYNAVVTHSLNQGSHPKIIVELSWPTRKLYTLPFQEDMLLYLLDINDDGLTYSTREAAEKRLSETGHTYDIVEITWEHPVDIGV